MSEPLAPIFFSTFMYAAYKAVGEHAPAWLAFQLEHLDASEMAGFRTLGQARRVFAECKVFVDGSTYITRARCVAAGHFLRKAGAACDVWLTCDDDVYADADVLRQLVLACRSTRGMVALPYLNRDGGSMTFRRVAGPTVWHAVAADQSVPLRTVDRVGMGLVAMHRDFVSALDLGAPHFEDDYPALFLEGVEEVDPDTGRGVWTGEDYWVCGLAEKAGLPMHVLLDAPAEHAGKWAKLGTDGAILVDPKHAAFLEESLTKKERAFRERGER